MRFIHQHRGWPDFKWDAPSLSYLLAEVRNAQGRLLGRMDGLGLPLRVQATLTTLTADVTKSSAIEGEFLDQEQVRSSIARKLGMDVGGMVSSSRNIDGIVEMMLDATQNFKQPLTCERLFAWQAALFPTGRSGMTPITVGNWRTSESGPMQVVSGAIGRERVHFEAPSAYDLDTVSAAGFASAAPVPPPTAKSPPAIATARGSRETPRSQACAELVSFPARAVPARKASTSIESTRRPAARGFMMLFPTPVFAFRRIIEALEILVWEPMHPARDFLWTRAGLPEGTSPEVPAPASYPDRTCAPFTKPGQFVRSARKIVF